MRRTVDYQKILIQQLKDPEHALGYLNECLQDEYPEVFLSALRDVVDAHGGIRKLSQKTKLNREHLFRMLSHKGNPRLKNLQTLADALGWRLMFVEKEKTKLRKAA